MYLTRISYNSNLKTLFSDLVLRYPYCEAPHKLRFYEPVDCDAQVPTSELKHGPSLKGSLFDGSRGVHYIPPRSTPGT